MRWVDLLGYAAALTVFATFYMSTMRPLRILALASNVLFALYGFFGELYPVLILHVALFPINLARLHEVQKLIGRAANASTAPGLAMTDLLPFMRRRQFGAGQTLFSKGDFADRLYYIGAGTVEIKEIGIALKTGEMFGEIGLFAPDHKRMATVATTSPCELYELEEAKVRELYFQNPAFGFAVMRLITMRLLEDAALYREGQSARA
jgi:hypothetical protein